MMEFKKSSVTSSSIDNLYNTTTINRDLETSILNNNNNKYFLINSNISTKHNSHKSPTSILIFILTAIFFIITQVSNVSAQSMLAADVAVQLSVSDFQCVQNSSINYVIIGCWKGTGHPNPTCSSNIQAAISSQIQSVDVYLEPCYSCGQPVYQATQMVNYISTFPVNINVAWVDISIPDNWGNNTLDNRVFFEQLTQTMTNRGVQVGVFSSQQTWGVIMGLEYYGGSSFPLWYTDLDGVASFNDFVTFSGWLSPSLKRYSSVTICNVISVNLDYTNTQDI